MKRESTLRLNTHYLVARIESMGLKQWWLARQLQVDRKTVGRWVSGSVKRISKHNLGGLVRELNCDLEDLVLRDEADSFATRSEQTVAAAILLEQDLLSLLAPTDDWKLAESLIKATMEPHLPLRSMGQLYNLLSIASWRQGDYDVAADRADRALSIGKRTGDRDIEMRAILNLGTIHSFVGPIKKSLTELEMCLERPEYFDRDRNYGNTLSNVAWLYREAGDLERALETQRRSVSVFERSNAVQNLTISWISIAVQLTELSRFDEALAAVENARSFAKDAKYERGHSCCDFYEADIHCLRGDFDAARELLERARPKLDEYPVFDLACIEITARFYRRSGQVRRGREEIDLGVERALEFPMILRAMLSESIRIAKAENDEVKAATQIDLVNQILEKQGLGSQHLCGDTAEYGTVRQSG